MHISQKAYDDMLIRVTINHLWSLPTKHKDNKGNELKIAKGIFSIWINEKQNTVTISRLSDNQQWQTTPENKARFIYKLIGLQILVE